MGGNRHGSSETVFMRAPGSRTCGEIAALPYDVCNREEAKREVKSHPLSFLAIDRPETGFPDTADMYAPEVYAHAKDLFRDNG